MSGLDWDRARHERMGFFYKCSGKGGKYFGLDDLLERKAKERIISYIERRPYKTERMKSCSNQFSQEKEIVKKYFAESTPVFPADLKNSIRHAIKNFLGYKGQVNFLTYCFDRSKEIKDVVAIAELVGEEGIEIQINQEINDAQKLVEAVTTVFRCWAISNVNNEVKEKITTFWGTNTEPPESICRLNKKHQGKFIKYKDNDLIASDNHVNIEILKNEIRQVIRHVSGYKGWIGVECYNFKKSGRASESVIVTHLGEEEGIEIHLNRQVYSPRTILVESVTGVSRLLLHCWPPAARASLAKLWKDDVTNPIIKLNKFSEKYCGKVIINDSINVTMCKPKTSDKPPPQLIPVKKQVNTPCVSQEQKTIPPETIVKSPKNQSLIGIRNKAKTGDIDAIEEILEMAESGDVPAMRYLGDIYFYGQGKPKDLQLAKTWYLKAFIPKRFEDIAPLSRIAQAGDVEAQMILGKYYLTVEPQPELAFKWFTLAAEQGSHEARQHLSEMMKKCKG